MENVFNAFNGNTMALKVWLRKCYNFVFVLLVWQFIVENMNFNNTIQYGGIMLF